jgi:hypothetical protein
VRSSFSSAKKTPSATNCSGTDEKGRQKQNPLARIGRNPQTHKPRTPGIQRRTLRFLLIWVAMVVGGVGGVGGSEAGGRCWGDESLQRRACERKRESASQAMVPSNPSRLLPLRAHLPSLFFPSLSFLFPILLSSFLLLSRWAFG